MECSSVGGLIVGVQNAPLSKKWAIKVWDGSRACGGIGPSCKWYGQCVDNWTFPGALFFSSMQLSAWHYEHKVNGGSRLLLLLQVPTGCCMLEMLVMGELKNMGVFFCCRGACKRILLCIRRWQIWRQTEFFLMRLQYAYVTALVKSSLDLVSMKGPSPHIYIRRSHGAHLVYKMWWYRERIMSGFSQQNLIFSLEDMDKFQVMSCAKQIQSGSQLMNGRSLQVYLLCLFSTPGWLVLHSTSCVIILMDRANLQLC
jgi:hypothetical protein